MTTHAAWHARDMAVAVAAVSHGTCLFGRDAADASFALVQPHGLPLRWAVQLTRTSARRTGRPDDTTRPATARSATVVTSLPRSTRAPITPCNLGHQLRVGSSWNGHDRDSTETMGRNVCSIIAAAWLMPNGPAETIWLTTRGRLYRPIW